MRIPGMLLIGSFHRNAGKTTMSSDIISRCCDKVSIIAVKTTIIRNNNSSLEPCGFLLTEETDPLSGKDTARMKQAGASRVLWLRARENAMLAGMNEVVKLLPIGAALLCEGNTIRHVVRPDVFIMVRSQTTSEHKPSALNVCAKADLIVETENGCPPLPSDYINFRFGSWHLDHNLLSRDGILLPHMESLPCRSD